MRHMDLGHQSPNRAWLVRIAPLPQLRNPRDTWFVTLQSDERLDLPIVRAIWSFTARTPQAHSAPCAIARYFERIDTVVKPITVRGSRGTRLEPQRRS